MVAWETSFAGFPATSLCQCWQWPVVPPNHGRPHPGLAHPPVRTLAHFPSFPAAGPPQVPKLPSKPGPQPSQPKPEPERPGLQRENLRLQPRNTSKPSPFPPSLLTQIRAQVTRPPPSFTPQLFSPSRHHDDIAYFLLLETLVSPIAHSPRRHPIVYRDLRLDGSLQSLGPQNKHRQGYSHPRKKHTKQKHIEQEQDLQSTLIAHSERTRGV